MENRFASLDTTWPHLPAPSQALWPCPTWFSPAAAFENDALASALAHASASTSSPTPSSSTTTSSSASELSSAPYYAPAPAPAPAQPVTCGPGSSARHCTGRVSKKKPRASRRPPTTYISADPADFRRMVQEITGFGAEHASAIEARRRPDPLPFVLPTLDTSACFLLDQARPFPQQRWEDETSSGAGTVMAPAAADAGMDDSSLLLMQELEAMMSAPAAGVSAFPTLESWGMI